MTTKFVYTALCSNCGKQIEMLYVQWDGGVWTHTDTGQAACNPTHNMSTYADTPDGATS